MADVITLAAWLADPNMAAFLRVIRAGETSQSDDAYRMLFGGELIDSFADHPRRAITRKLGSQTLTSTAAGAYQFLMRTWDGLVRIWGFRDFEPRTQDLACVALIHGRKAVDDVLAGRFELAVAKCAREWASLPGSPYGQPVKTMAQARTVYEDWGGRYEAAAEAPPAPVKTLDTQPQEVTTMPLPAFASVALPLLVEAIPKLGKLFGSGSEVAERNVQAAETVINIVSEAVGAKNAQEAVEAIKADPALAQAAQKAVEDRWYELTEAGGGGIDGARKADLARIGAAGHWYDVFKSHSFLVALVMLPLVYLIVLSIIGVIGKAEWSADVRAAIAGTIVGSIVGGLVGYYYGQTTSRNRAAPAAD